jgi:hypothetical protein
MERKPTADEIRRFNAKRSGNTAPARKPEYYKLTDNFGNVFAQGSYGLCVHVKKTKSVKADIVPVYKNELPVIKGFTPKFP